MEKKKPVSATTAVANELSKTESEKVNDESSLLEKTFTKEEVENLLKSRLDRQVKSILSRYGVSSLEELDALVTLSRDINDAVDKFRSTSAYNSIVISKEQKDSAEFVRKLKDIISWDKISISIIMRHYEIGFTRAGKIFNELLEKKLVAKVKRGQREFYVPNTYEISSFIMTHKSK